MDDIEAHESKLYSELAPLYDKVFGKIFYSRLERVIEDLDIPAGAKILEVGAGTGTSFPAYPTHCEINGVDFATDVPVLVSLTQSLHPMTRWLGWRTDLKLKPFIETSHLKVEKVYKLNKASLYTVLIFKKEKKSLRPLR